MKEILITLMILIGIQQSEARSRVPVNAFIKTHPCPSTGQNKAPCPGYVVDHIIPLCAGGADLPSNMQWQEKLRSFEKDKAERSLCIWIRRARIPLPKPGEI